MRCLLCHLTATMMLAHVVLGCCWHHQHSFGNAWAWTTGADDAALDWHADACGRVLGTSPQPAGGPRRDRGGCDGSRCAWVTEQPSKAPVVFGAGFDDAVTAAATLDSGIPPGATPPAKTPAATGNSSSLRIHLLQQVLLL